MKGYRIKYVGKRHPLCRGSGEHSFFHSYIQPDKTIKNKEIRYYWKRWSLSPCHKAAVFLHNNKIVAFFRFYHYPDGDMYDAGTWVSKRHRGKRLGRTLWERVIKKFKPKTIHVYAASPAGYLLVKEVKKQHKNIAFRIGK